MMSIAQRSAETVKQNQSEAGMNVDMRDINVTVVPPDMLILVSMNKLRQMTNELEAAKEVVEASRVGSFHHPACPYFDGEERCGCSNQLVKDALKAYDEARRG